MWVTHALVQEPAEIASIIFFICGISTKNYKLFSAALGVLELKPFDNILVQFSHCKAMEACEPK